MPARSVIKPLVTSKIASLAHVSKVTEDQELQADLSLSATPRRALAVAYNGIISEYDGVLVTFDEAGDLKTVGDAIDLVWNRSNGVDE